MAPRTRAVWAPIAIHRGGGRGGGDIGRWLDKWPIDGSGAPLRAHSPGRRYSPMIEQVANRWRSKPRLILWFTVNDTIFFCSLFTTGRIESLQNGRKFFSLKLFLFQDFIVIMISYYSFPFYLHLEKSIYLGILVIFGGDCLWRLVEWGWKIFRYFSRHLLPLKRSQSIHNMQMRQIIQIRGTLALSYFRIQTRIK